MVLQVTLEINVGLSSHIALAPNGPRVGQGAASMSAGAQYFFAVGGAPFVIGEESSYLRSFSVKVSYAWGKRSHEDDIIIDFGSYAGSVAGPRNTAEAVEHLTKQLAKKA